MKNLNLSKLLALCLALALMVSLTGCFQKDTPEATEPDDQVVQETPTDAPATEAPTDAPATEAPTEAPVEAVKGTVSANNLNVRSNPSTDSTVLSQLPVDLAIDILEQKTVGDTKWGRIGQMTLPNGTKISGGWINLHYVRLAGEEIETPTEAPTTGNQSVSGTGKKGTITASKLNIRQSTSTTSEAVGSYLKGDVVEILEQKTVDGTTWGRTNKGWISMKYVSFDGQTTTTEKEEDKTTTSTEVVSNGKTSVLGYAVIDLGSLNVRSGPGTKYDKITTVSEGSRYAYYQKEGNWIRIKDGWISTSYAYIEGGTASDGGTGTVTATELNIRKGPDASYSSTGVLKKGDSVTILAQVGDWGYTSKGWVSMKYVKMAEPTYAAGTGTITTDLNIRKEANAESEKVGTYKKGDKVTVTDVKDGWGKTDKGWISMKYVSMTSSSTEVETGKNTTYKEGKATVVVNTSLTIRKEGKADAEKVGSYANGDKVTITKVSGEWGKTDKGWINLKYVKYD